MSIALLAKNSSGQPLAGLSPTWATYRNALTGASQGAPGFTALGNGLYKFDPTGSSPVGIVDLGATAVPRYLVYTSAVPVRVFAAFDELGVPLAGLVPSWNSLRRVDTGVAYTPQPAFAALGDGLYKTALYTGIHLTGGIDLGTTAYPRYVQYDSEILSGIYQMRAFKTSVPTGYVYWLSPDAPDLTGDLSGYSPGDLLDIVVMDVLDEEDASVGGVIDAWVAGTYSEGQAVTRGPYVWRANTTTTEDPFLVEGNLGSNTDWVPQTAGTPGMVQTPGSSDGAPNGKILLINNAVGSQVAAYRQSVNTGFLGKMLVVDLQISGTADWLHFGVFDSAAPQTAADLLTVTGFYGVNIFIYSPSTAKIENIINGSVATNVAYANANSTNAGSAFSRWYLKMVQNGLNWDLELLRPATRAVSSPYTGFDPEQEDDLVPIARFTNVARPSYTNWRFVIGARTGAAAGIFSCRAAYVRDIVSNAWSAVSRMPNGL